jgi:hypothetical protein
MSESSSSAAVGKSCTQVKLYDKAAVIPAGCNLDGTVRGSGGL